MADSTWHEWHEWDRVLCVLASLHLFSWEVMNVGLGSLCAVAGQGPIGREAAGPGGMTADMSYI